MVRCSAGCVQSSRMWIEKLRDHLGWWIGPFDGFGFDPYAAHVGCRHFVVRKRRVAGRFVAVRSPWSAIILSKEDIVGGEPNHQPPRLDRIERTATGYNVNYSVRRDRRGDTVGRR